VSTDILLLPFLAGLLSFLSPCIIPMLGVYFSLITGLTSEQLKSETLRSNLRRKVLINTFAFVAGFGLIFTAAGSIAGSLGSVLGQWLNIFSIIGGFMILVLALKLLGIFELSFLSRLHWEPKFYNELRQRPSTGPVIAFIVGLIFAIACSHCIAPTLYTILFMAGASQSWVSGMLIMGIFSLGLAIPYVITGLFYHKVLKLLKRYQTQQVYIRRVLGLLMLFFAYILFTNQLTEVTGFLSRFLPNLPYGM